MAVKVLSSAWRALAGLYRLPGQESAPPALELGLPVQPVHDLSRMAEYSSWPAGVFEHSVTSVALAGTTDRSQFNRQALFLQAGAQAALRRLGLSNENQVDVWLLAIYGYLDSGSSVADLTEAQAGVIQGGAGYEGAEAQVLFVANSVLVATSLLTTNERCLAFEDGANVQHSPTSFAQQQFPVFMSPAIGTAACIECTAGAGGSIAVQWKFLYHFVPRGVRPPGMA